MNEMIDLFDEFGLDYLRDLRKDKIESDLKFILNILYWKATDGISNREFKQLKHILRKKVDLPSLATVFRKLRETTDLKCQRLHCCPSSCMAFTGDNSNTVQCRCGISCYQMLPDGTLITIA